MISMPRVTEAAQQIAMPVRPRATGAVAASGARLAELALLLFAGALLLFSISLPYWEITLHAPQYPKGLHVQAFVNKLTGDVFEVDGLNHYIGMMKLNDAAVIERQIAVAAIVLTALLAIASFWMSGVWRVFARIPIVIFPIVFAADLFAWLYHAGHSLYPYAPLSSSIKPFTPHIVGIGTIGQFSTEAVFLPGYFLAVAAALTVLGVSIWRKGEDHVAR